MPHSLDAIFNPRSIAVHGATEHMGSVGYSILRNLLQQGYEGTIVPINRNTGGSSAAHAT